MSRLERHEAIVGAARCGADLDLLRTVLERHVIPQLVTRPRAEGPRAGPLDPDLVDQMTARAVAGDLPAAQALFDAFLAQGGQVEALVSACAARLGEGWESDVMSFVEVTAGLGVLASLVTLDEAAVGASARGVVLLTTAPGEQHTLGLQLVAQALRRDGWSVDVEPSLTPVALTQRVASSRVDAVGFTVSRAALLPALATAIRALRSASPAAPEVMVGGPLPLTAFADTNGARALTSPESAVEWLRALRPRVSAPRLMAAR